MVRARNGRKATKDPGVESVRRAVAIVQLLHGSLHPVKARRFPSG